MTENAFKPWLIVAAVVLAVSYAKAMTSPFHMSSNQDDLRARFQALASIQDQDEFLTGYWTLLHEQGLEPALNHGGSVIVGHGMMIRLDPSEEQQAWVFQLDEGREVLPWSNWVRFATEQGLTTQAPQEGTDYSILVSTKESLSMIDAQTGMKRLVRAPGRK